MHLSQWKAERNPRKIIFLALLSILDPRTVLSEASLGWSFECAGRVRIPVREDAGGSPPRTVRPVAKGCSGSKRLAACFEHGVILPVRYRVAL